MNKYDLNLLNIWQKIHIILWSIFNNNKFKQFYNFLLIGMSSRAAYNKCKNYEKKAKELSELFKAYSEGKIIEYKSPGAECWDVDNNFGGSMLAIQYRIKPEPKLVPFTFEDADLLISKSIKSKTKDVITLIQVVYPKNVMMHGFDTISYYSLLQNWEFLDGSPCGKYIE